MEDQRWCSWHHDDADDAVLIVVTEFGSGPGIMHYACRHCRTAFGLVPLDLTLLDAAVEEPG